MERSRLNTLPPTQVLITVDTEFSIAGHFNDPEHLKPISMPLVYGQNKGKAEGLGFILDAFSRYNIDGTFFVEVANINYFGTSPIKSVVQDIQDANQDVQLHIHPVWMSFSGEGGDGRYPRQDDCAGQDYEYLRDVFCSCVETFKEVTGTSPIALRTGNLRSDLNTYKVIRELGIPLTSNVALGVCKPLDEELCCYSGRHTIEGVTELPVTTYQAHGPFGKKKLKSLQITSCSWPEIKHILLKARKSGIEQIVILTHPFEFFKSSDNQCTETIRNRVNQERLTKLCAFIEENEGFTSTNFVKNLANWSQSATEGVLLEVSDYYSLGRKVHNKINDLIWKY